MDQNMRLEGLWDIESIEKMEVKMKRDYLN